MEVPPEVLGRILACLDKKDLKEVRLVCKKLERSAVSLLFDEVYLSTNPAEIEIMQNTVRNFGNSIKTVFFSAVDYREIKWGRFKNAVGRPIDLEHVRLAYTNYCRLRQEQQQMLRAGTFFGHLCYALRTLPNAQRLVITGFEACSHPRDWQRRRSRLWRVGDCPAHCSIQGCVRGNLLHLTNMVRPRRLWRTGSQLRTGSQESDSETEDADPETQDADPWSLVMMGLAATGSRIRELELDSSDGGFVPRGGFDNTLQQPFALQEVFQHFRKLGLSFRLNDQSVEKNIAKTLSTATNLKSLCIIVGWDAYREYRCRYRPGGPSAFKEILGECQFPQLRSLMLHGFTSTEAELLDFLHGSSLLQQLTLTYHQLGWKDNWESCANGIKLALPTLKHVIVDALTSNFGCRNPTYHTQHCRRTDVQGFFFQGKANPFACAQARDERTQLMFLATDNDNSLLEF